MQLPGIMTRNLLIVMAAALSMISCNNEIFTPSVGVGYLAVELSAETTDGTKAEDVDLADFDIVITGPSELSCKCAELPEIVALEPGYYTISVASPFSEPAAFEQPIFGAESGFEIQDGATSSVKLICTMQNMKVTIRPSDAFRSQMKSYTVTVDNSYGELTWTQSEIDAGVAGYFTVAPLAISLTGISLGDAELSYDGLITDVEASDHHVITFDSL